MIATTEATSDLKFQPLEPSTPSDLPERRRFPRRSKIKASGARFRLKREFSKRSSRLPETPLLKWKFDEENGYEKSSGDVIRPEISARKLAAGMWRRSLANVGEELGHQAGGGHFAATFHCRRVDKVRRSPDKDLANSPHSLSSPKSGLRHKFPSRFQFPSSAIEGATKWDPNGWKASDEIVPVFGQSKPSTHRASAAIAISTLEAHLDQARTRINELETERRSSKKKLEQFLRKLSDERAVWRSREHEKIRAIIDDIKAELSREKKNRQMLEIVNSKLVNELADAKALSKRYLQEYRKEKKARELVEVVCDELANEIGEDKTEVDAIRRESMKLQEEVEDERKMLQMAEVWREERVQMKLVDAKVMLEEKYAQMNRAVEDLTIFLKSRRVTSDEEIKKADLLLQAASAVNIQDVRELKYEPPNPDDIFSAFEGIIERESGQCGHPNVYTEDDASEWETSSHPDDEDSSYSPDGSDPSVSKHFKVLRGATQWEKNQSEETPTVEFTEVDSVKKRNSKKVSTMTKLSKIVSLNGMLFDTSSPAAQWHSPASGNRHATQDIRGYVEPRYSAQKSSSRAARTEGQKIQLRQVLEHEI